MDLVRLKRRLGWSELLVVALCAALGASFGAGLIFTRHTQAQLLSPGPLTRAHAEVEGDANCARCHQSGRRVGATLCFECHDDLGRRVSAGRGLHGTEYRGRDCGTCHVEHVGAGAPLVRWPGGRREGFDHRMAGWPLEGGHAGVTCDRCHDGHTSTGTRSYLGESTACRSCHEDPHEGRMGNECTTCHTVERWNRVSMEGFDHSHTRFALRGAHTSVACAGCHGSPARYRGIAFSTCSSCHEDPHEGRFEQACSTCHTETSWNELSGLREGHPGLSLGGGHAEVRCERCHDAGTSAPPSRGTTCVSCHHRVHEADLGTNCISCHASIRWMGLRRPVGLRAHEHTPFPLNGRHADVDCEGCHSPDQPRDVRFRQLTFDTCGACHSDPHGGELTDLEGGDCAGCHDDGGFRPSHFGVASHTHASFPLDGRHESVPCSSCHGSTRPRVSFRIAESTCASCHENPHREEFAAEMAAGGCATCHETAGWDRPRIDHTSFPLTGAHAVTRCDSCHTPSEEDRRSGSGASYRGLPHDCSGCHDDEHEGQFRLTEPVRECTSCHDTTTFALPNFDHAGVTSFPIEGAHERVECSGCHPTVELRDGVEAVRYRLGYRTCADCHANPHATEGAR